MRHIFTGALVALLASPALATDPQLGAIRVEIAPNVRHAFVSAQAQSSNSSIVSRNEWNAAHTVPAALVLSVPTGLVWPAQPAALTEFCGASTSYRWRADLTNATSIRLTAQVISAGAATSALRLQYTTDTTGATGWDYLDGSAGPSVSIAASGVAVSSSVNLATAAKADVLLRLVGINGDGAGGTACYSGIKSATAALADSATTATTATSATSAATATALAADGANCSAGQFPLGVDASGAAQSCTALPTTISGTANQIAASASTGGITLSIPTNPTLPGTTTGTFSGNITGAVTGNASTATALASDPADCSAGSAARGIDASGAAASCFAVPSGTGTVSGTNTGDQTTITGNAGTASALAADGANCSAGSAPLGVDASGASQGCFAVPSGTGTVSGTNTGDQTSVSGNAGTATLAASTSAIKSATTTVNVDAAAAPSAGQVLTATDATHATWQAAGSTITSGSSVTSGCVAGGVLRSISNLVQCGAGLTFDGSILTLGSATSAGRSMMTVKDAGGGTGSSDNFFKVIGTSPSVPTGTLVGARFDITSGGSATFSQGALSVSLLAGYTGNGLTYSSIVSNSAAGTGNSLSGSKFNAGEWGQAVASTAGNNIGGYFVGSGSSSLNYGVVGSAVAATNTPPMNVGAAGFALSATNNIAIYASLTNRSAPPSATAAVLADNGAVSADIIAAYDNGTKKWYVGDGGQPISATTIPAVSNTSANSCGTTAATIAGTNETGIITVGATAGTSCTVTFAVAAPTRRQCYVNNETTGNLARSTYSSTTVSIFSGTFVAGDVLSYGCQVY